jgi:RHS repeat-associated protein
MAYTYDAAGNITANGTLTFTYDTWGRLATVKQGASTKATYRYNAFGQRVSKVAGSVTTYYVYDDTGLLLGEYNSSGTAIQEFVWLDGLPAMILTPSANYYVHPDHLGTPRLVYNAAGKIIWRWNSDPFGATAANEDPDGDKVKFTFNLRFPGQVFDKESGLHYNYFRDYDPSIGRYVQADPIGLKGGWNVYGYVGGNPLSKIDLFGLMDDEPGLEPVCVECLIPLMRLPGLAKDLNVDGPKNTRICQVRYKKQPVFRLDYGPYKGTQGEPRLHMHLPGVNPDLHIPLDPRTLIDK